MPSLSTLKSELLKKSSDGRRQETSSGESWDGVTSGHSLTLSAVRLIVLIALRQGGRSGQVIAYFSSFFFWLCWGAKKSTWLQELSWMRSRWSYKISTTWSIEAITCQATGRHEILSLNSKYVEQEQSASTRECLQRNKSSWRALWLTLATGESFTSTIHITDTYNSRIHITHKRGARSGM